MAVARTTSTAAPPSPPSAEVSSGAAPLDAPIPLLRSTSIRVSAKLYPLRGTPRNRNSFTRRSPRQDRHSSSAPIGDISDDADDIWLTTEDVARRLQIPQKTLAAWASNSRGPQYVRMVRYRRYRLSDLRA
ncbi:helix-turn-helix domain-containing protein [Nocardia sp. NPDC052112]|uniref:helix-turn-helix domain-containing protein n=1 Tax=Nocardia sp. NPDC052112 TaxID=3155646 RepID=UPI00343C3E14